jgi:uncharacterized membrane protein
MNKARLEAFSDGVLAVIITIMVLEIKEPKGHEFSDLKELIPIFLTYILSFIYLGIYWNNHHHMMHTVHGVRGNILWANLYLLFWLSLIPFSTSWIGLNHFETAPMALYGFILLMAAIAYNILQNQIIKNEGKNSILAKAVGKDKKGKASLFLYMVAILSCWISTLISGSIYILVALIWLVPDTRIENITKENEKRKI